MSSNRLLKGELCIFESMNRCLEVLRGQGVRMVRLSAEAYIGFTHPKHQLLDSFRFYFPRIGG